MLSTLTIDNFRQLLRAARAGRLILLDCTDAETGEPVATICGVERRDGLLTVAPYAAMLVGGDPLRTLQPPLDDIGDAALRLGGD